MSGPQLLLLDAGNTRVKWMVVDATATEWLPLRHGALNTEDLKAETPAVSTVDPIWDLTSLRQALALEYEAGPVVACHVGHVLGASFGMALVQQCTEVGPPVSFLQVQPSEVMCSDYHTPHTLGLDRWAGAWSVTANKSAGVHFVVSFGTATTVDVVEHQLVGPSQWRHCGGMIFPGERLMRSALAQGTAQLPWSDAEVESLPLRTDTAIATGVHWAQLGAVTEFVRSVIGVRATTPRLVLHGGNAFKYKGLISQLLAPWCVEVDEEAVFRGLWLHWRHQRKLEAQ